MEPFGAIWSHLEPFGAIWSHLETFGDIWNPIQIFPFFLLFLLFLLFPTFRNGFHDKSAQTNCSKEMWIPILKGLKHLNTVLKTKIIQLPLVKQMMFRFFTNECTHLLKTGNFGRQGPQNAALQQRYSPC